ncbi:cyclic nucleotide-binding domain-containing protein [Pseudomonas sp. HK3]|jgi:CRP-like cAMP-binding protein
MKRITTLGRGRILLILNKVPFFNRFTPLEKEKVIDTDASFYVAQENEYIIEQNTLDTAFFILLSGTANVLLDGNEKPLAEVGPGDFFGEISFIQNTPRTSNVVANEVCILLKVDRRLLGALNSDIREKFKDQVIIKLAAMVTAKNNNLEKEVSS